MFQAFPPYWKELKNLFDPYFVEAEEETRPEKSQL